jgi:iron-sulfur cluster assembly protein
MAAMSKPPGILTGHKLISLMDGKPASERENSPATTVTNRGSDSSESGIGTGEGRCYHRAMVTVTERAASKILELMAEEPEGEVSVLRVAIQGGGCSGFQYALGFDRGPQDGDNQIESHGVCVVIDPFSAPYLAGAEIDFVDALMGGGFAINNPNVVASCGCGSSFQAKEDMPGEAAYHGHAGGCGSGCAH